MSHPELAGQGNQPEAGNGSLKGANVVHSAILGSKLTSWQGVPLTGAWLPSIPMDYDDGRVRAEFSARMHEICDDKGLAKVGRQTALAKVFGVTNKAARRWLEGIGYPEMALAIRIADWADVNLNWLLQGAGPKRGNRVDGKALVLDEAVRALTREQGTDLLDTIRAKLARIGKLTSLEEGGKYDVMLHAYEKEFERKRPD